MPDTQAGCTVQVVTANLDAGAILGQATVPSLPRHAEATLSDRVLVQEHRLYPDVLHRFATGFKSRLHLN